MKKLSPIILIAAMAFSIKANAQSGINTTTPTATLDVRARNATGTTTGVDGLLIPRVDRQRAQNMLSVPVSTLIYVDNIATGATSGTAVNIDAIGYYSYNGTAWVKLIAASNIYNTDGTLTANRTVSQGTNTLAFAGTAVNAFSVDGSTLSVDASNDRIGIGTTSPAVKLDVAQAIGTSEATHLRILNTSTRAVGNTAYMGFNVGGGGASWGIGAYQNSATDQNDNSFNILYSNGGGYIKRLTVDPNGNIGVGTISPSNKLDVNGSARVRTMAAASAGSVVGRVFADDNGVLMKSSAAAYGNVSTASATASAGANVTLASGIVTGFYKCFVSAYDGCVRSSTAEFYINFDGGYSSIVGIGGMVSGPTTDAKTPTFTELSLSSIQVVWKANLGGCQDGSNGTTSFNFTLGVSSGGIVTVTNNGNVSKTYNAIFERVR